MAVTQAPKMPSHVAIIMDGNGRYAKRAGQERVWGHKKGSEVALDVIEWCSVREVKVLTLFALSTENMLRPNTEIDFIVDLLVSTIIKEKSRLIENGIYLNMLGNWRTLHPALVELVEQIQQKTKHTYKVQLNLAFNYGGRWHIADCIKTYRKELLALKETVSIEAFIEKKMQQDLGMPPDLMIRTGGQMRLSNFLLWPLAYSELRFLEMLWPDFTEKDLEDAFFWYSERVRKFGQIEETIYG